MTEPVEPAEPALATVGANAAQTVSSPMAVGELGLARRVALVSGAGRGLGRAISLALGSAGACVALCSRTLEELDEVSSTITDAGGLAEPFPADLTDTGRLEELVSEVEEEMGPIEVLVNAAGISPTYTRAERVSAADYDVIMNTNLRAAFFLTQEIGNRMLKRGNGAIVNISSIGASVALPRLAAYCAAKGAIEALTRVLAVEWAPRGVRVNAVAPAFAPTALSNGVINHPEIGPWLLSQTPIGRFATPDEIASAALFLCSDAASYITGVTLAVDGGWTAQ